MGGITPINDLKFFDKKLGNDYGDPKVCPRTKAWISGPGSKVVKFGMVAGAVCMVVGLCCDLFRFGNNRTENGYHQHGQRRMRHGNRGN